MNDLFGISLFKNFNFDDFITKILTILGQLALATVVFLLILSLGKRLIGKGFDQQIGRQSNKTGKGRKKTIKSLTLNVFQYTVLFFYLYSVLSILGLPVGTLIASAGIASVAIGLGAQGFVSDVVNGLFILTEQQFDVGDFVNIGSISGTVVAMGIRTTQIKGIDGTLNYIPNRNISIVTNYNRGNMTAIIDLQILADNDFQQVKAIIKDVNKRLTPQFDIIKRDPDIIGITGQNGDVTNYRIQIQTKNGSQATIKSAFMAAYLEALAKANIKLPQNSLNITTSK